MNEAGIQSKLVSHEDLDKPWMLVQVDSEMYHINLYNEVQAAPTTQPFNGFKSLVPVTPKAEKETPKVLLTTETFLQHFGLDDEDAKKWVIK